MKGSWKRYGCPACGNVVDIKDSRNELYDCPQCETTLIRLIEQDGGLVSSVIQITKTLLMKSSLYRRWLER